MEARTSTSTTTTVLESKGGESNAPATRVSKRTMMDDFYTTFSSPVAWVLVLALIITWSAVAIIVFDLVDTKSLEGGIQHMSREPVKAVHEVVEESTNWMSAISALMTNLVAPEEEEEEVEWQAVKKKGEFLPARKKVTELQAMEIIQQEEDERRVKEEEEEEEEEEEDEKKTSVVEKEKTEEGEEDEEEEEDEDDEADEEDEEEKEEEEKKTVVEKEEKTEEDEEEDDDDDDDDDDEEEKETSAVKKEEKTDEGEEDDDDEKEEEEKDGKDADTKADDAEDEDQEKAEKEKKKDEKKAKPPPKDTKDTEIDTKEKKKKKEELQVADKKEERKVKEKGEPEARPEGKVKEEKEKKKKEKKDKEEKEKEMKTEEKKEKEKPEVITVRKKMKEGADKTKTDEAAAAVEEAAEERRAAADQTDAETKTDADVDTGEEDKAADRTEPATEPVDVGTKPEAVEVADEEEEDEKAADEEDDDTSDVTPTAAASSEETKEDSDEEETAPVPAAEVKDEEADEKIADEMDEEEDTAIVDTEEPTEDKVGGDAVTTQPEARDDTVIIGTAAVETDTKKHEEEEDTDEAEKTEEVKADEGEAPKPVSEDQQKESTTCVCMQPDQPTQTQIEDTKPEEEKVEEKKEPHRISEQVMKQAADSELPQKKEDVDVVAPLHDLPACRPTPVYCPAPPGWYVHHIVTDSPLPPTPVREDQFAAIATHAVTLQRQAPVADQEKPKQATQKKEPPVKRRRTTPTKKATVSKLLKVKTHEEKVKTQKKKGHLSPKEKLRLIPHRREVPKLTKHIRSAGPVIKKVNILEHGKNEKKGVKGVKPTVQEKNKSKTVEAKRAAHPAIVPRTMAVKSGKETRSTKADHKEKKISLRSTPEETEQSGKPARDQKGPVSDENTADPPAVTKESKVEENVTERKKPGKIPYFQCVLVGGKASQYPLRPLSPATTPAINPAMMRAMMEQRASVLEHQSQPSGQ